MTKLIIGLGNPEPEYRGTRHNIGRFVVSEWVVSCGLADFSLDKELDALVSSGDVGGEWVVCVFPDKYMNNSGVSVKKAMKKYGVEAKDVIIVHDDLDLPFGTLRIAQDRGVAGHNGLQSIVDQVGSKEFGRVRIGISPVSDTGEMHKPQGDKSVQRFVLSRIPKGADDCLTKISKSSSIGMELMIKGDYSQAMQLCNGAQCSTDKK